MAGSTVAAQKPEYPARIIAILGMHRSGTSCLTGSLQQAGLSLGDCHTWNRYNLKGNRENQALVDLHDAILEANSGAWDKPPAKVAWSAEHRRRGAELLRQHAEEPVFGFKDPRALLVLAGWQELYPAMEYVGIFRHPNAVALSLQNRSEMPRDEAIALWFHYNSLLLRQYKSHRFPLLCFDDQESILQEKMARVVVRLGLNEGSSQPDFYSSELRTNSDEGGQALPWRVRRLYNKLRKISL